MRIPMRNGRLFDERDAERSLPVAIISESMARRFWPLQNPIEQRVMLNTEEPEKRWRTIIAVVGDVRHHPLDAAPQPTLYIPYTQAPDRSMTLVIRTSADPTRMAGAVRARIQSVDANQSVYEVRTMQRTIADAVAEIRIAAFWMTMLGVVALLLSGVGIYGVVSYSVAERTREIGIRVALGAQPRNVVRLIIGQAARLLVAGLALGLIGAFLLARGMASLLTMVTPEPGSFLGLTALLAGVGLLSSYLPLRRAVRVDPATTLRLE
jgi:putative ABC transport system permease protein